jgi:hypothetical protein
MRTEFRVSPHKSAYGSDGLVVSRPTGHNRLIHPSGGVPAAEQPERTVPSGRIVLGS